MLPVSRSSPENSRLLGLLFSNYLNLHIKISNFLAKSDHFEHFLKNSIFENFYKCFDPFCMRKNWFWDVQFSGWIGRFWAIFEKFHFWKFLQVFWPILYGKKIDFEIFNFLDKSEDSEHFLKNFIFENFYKCFDPFCMGKNWIWTHYHKSDLRLRKMKNLWKKKNHWRDRGLNPGPPAPFTGTIPLRYWVMLKIKLSYWHTNDSDGREFKSPLCQKSFVTES